MTTRVISAVIAATLLICVSIIFKTTGLYAISTIVVIGCIYEFTKLTLVEGDAPAHINVSFGALAFMTYVAAALRADLAILFATLSAIILLAMLVVSVRRSNDLGQAFKLASAALVGVFYVGLFPGFAVSLLGLEHGLTFYFGLLAIVFAGDTFAYLFGRLLGRRKLLESVSPKKTIEGALGGLLGSAIVGFCLQHFFLPDMPAVQMILVATVSGAFGQVGDLFESLIKRLADVKDSGRIMPGHGGFLDRLDGILFAAPVFAVLLRLLM
jgi:phosphatidate cytidylyltransferase